jgi:hypothetical protein
VTHHTATERGRIPALGRRFGLLSLALLLTSTALSAFTPAAIAVSAQQLVSTATAECPATNGCVGSRLTAGDVLDVTFNQAPTVTTPFSLTLTDGTDEGTVSSSGATVTVIGSTAAFTLTAAPTMTVGTGLSLSNLETLAASGVSSASGAWNLIESGQIDEADVTGSVSCATIAATRFFGGTNCSIGFGGAGPTPPEIYDVIPLPTYDLMGPPEDSAPEVITNCQAGSSDTVYDAVTGARLGADPCGTWLTGESSVGNTTSNTLDYIPTPTLASYETVAASETIPSSLYTSATVLPPQITGVSVSGATATFTYNVPVTCENTTSPHTVSQFDYEAPWWTTRTADLVWPASINCPPSTGATTLTLTYNQALPAAEKFKFEHYGPGYYIVGAAGSASFNQVTPSQSMYQGPAPLPPDPSIISFTGPAGGLTYNGGAATVSFAISDATQCALSASPSTGVTLSMPYVTSQVNPPASPNAPCPDSTGTGTVTLPANTTQSPQSYTITLTASSLHGTNPASNSIVLTVPAKQIGVITQLPPTSGAAKAGTPYSGQLMVTGNVGTVAYVQSSGSPSLTVSSSGAVSAPATLAAGTYTASGTDSDTSGGKGTWTYTLTVANAANLVSTATAECPDTAGCAVTTVGTGVELAAAFNQAPVLASGWSVTLTDGADEATLSSADATASVNGSTITFTMTSAPTLTVGTSLALSHLEVLSSSGITAGADPWDLIMSGVVDNATATGSRVCSNVGVTRVFGGSNCSMGFGGFGPTPPDVFDVIATPTYDLPGAPEDSAPEVITDCQAGSTDTVYDAVTGTQLGTDPCGTWLPGESTIGNTTSNTLDYIPTPALTSFEQIAVTEQLPSTLFQSATVIPPQVTGITVSGDTATYTYNGSVVCQSPGTPQTVSQFPLSAPWWTTQRVDLDYPGSVACPPSSGGNTITLTWSGPVPSEARFDYYGYGDGYFVVGAPNGPLAGEIEVSQSAYVGPTALPPNPTITSFTPPTGTISAAGGTFQLNFGISDATQCSLSASPSTGVGLSMPYNTSTQDPAPSPNAPCPDSTGTATVTLPSNTTGSQQSYTITLKAASLPGTTPTTRSITLVVPAGGITQTAPTSASTLAGTAYTGQLAVSDANPATFTQTGGAPSITVSSTGAISAPSTLQAGTYNASGTDSDGTGATGSWSFTLNVHPTTVATLVVSPATATITAGHSQTYTVEGFNSFGDDLGDVTSSSSLAIGPNGSCSGAVCTATVADTASGSHTVTATDGSATNTASLTVVAATVTATSGANQTAGTNAAFAQPLAATVTDAFGNPVPNAAVTFSAPTTGAGGSFSGAATATATTNASGVATSPTFTANSTVGSYSVTASAPGATTSASFPESNQLRIDFQVQQANGTTTLNGRAADKVTVTSNSATASGQVTLTVLLQASSVSGVTAASSLSGGSCRTTTPPAAYSAEVVCTISSMSSAAPWVVNLSMTATNKLVGAVAMVTAAGSVDPNLANNVQDTALTVRGGTTPAGTQADMAVTQSIPTTTTTGQAVDKATVTGTATAGPVTLDLLFQSTALTSFTSQSSISGATCQAMAAPPSGYVAGLECTLSSLAKGAQWAVTVTLNGPSAASINGVAAVSASKTVDPNLANNSQTTNFTYR